MVIEETIAAALATKCRVIVTVFANEDLILNFITVIAYFAAANAASHYFTHGNLLLFANRKAAGEMPAAVVCCYLVLFYNSAVL